MATRYNSKHVSQIWRGEEVKIASRRVTEKTIWETGLIIEGQAKLLCAVDTGRLAASITTQTEDQGTMPSGEGAVATDVISKPGREQEALVGTPVFYGPYIEFGTFTTRAQPFLRPALDLAKGRALTLAERNGRIEFKEYLQ